MITPELRLLAAQLEVMHQNANEILNRQYREIKQMPKEDQKQYWDDFFPMRDYVDESFNLLRATLRELEKRPTVQEFNSAKDTITKARKYITILGGNPSNLTYA